MPAKDPETGKPTSGDREDRPETREEEETRAEPRAERIPLGARRQRLGAPLRKGYARRWINDSPGRVEHAEKRSGWTFVTKKDEEGREERWSEIVGVNDDGNPLRAYLMEIPKEFYDQDQAEKQTPLDEFDKQLRRGIIKDADARDGDSFYVPKEGIHIETA